MKFLATLVASGALVAASYQDVVDDFSTIQSQTNALDSAIKAYQGASQANSIISQSNAVVASINKGVSDANAAAPFTTIQGAQLVQPVTNLAGTVDTTVKDLISKKSLLVSTCQGPATYKALTEQQSAATKFANAVTAKVPAALQSTAQQLSAQITDSLAQGVQAFSDSQQLPASCSGGSGPTTSSPPGSSTSAPSGSSTSAPAGSSSGAPGYGSSAPSYGNGTDVVSSTVYTTTTVCPLTMTTGGTTITSLTTSTITVTSCAGGCTKPAPYPTQSVPASSAPAQTYPAQTYPAGTGSAYPSSTSGLTPYTGAASRSQLSAAAVVALIPLAFFL